MNENLKNTEITLNEKYIKNNYSWVYSLPFFPKLLKRVKIISSIHMTNKNKLIKIIQKQRLDAIRKIIKAYRKFKLINQIKTEYIIRKVISERKNAIIKIQRNFKYFLKRSKVKQIIKKEKKCYIIVCNKTNVTKISIKFFTDYKNVDKTMVLPMQYCPIRKYFILRIPKTKFVLANKDNKIVHFNFLYNGNIFFDEDQYKIVNFNGKKVHEINFSKYDEINQSNNYQNKNNEENLLQQKNKLSYNLVSRHKSSYINTENLLDFSSDDEVEEKNKIRKLSKDSNGLKKPKYFRHKKKGKTLKLKSLGFLKIISILKDSNIDRKKRRKSTINPERHVKFGTVTFSY